MTDLHRLVALLSLAGLSLPRVACGFDWLASSPAEAGLSPDRVEGLVRGLLGQQTKSLLVTRGDRIVLEAYAMGQTRGKTHYSASLAKAVVGGLSLMLAMDDGRISPDDLACKYLPAWRDDPLKSRITLRMLATHTSGLQDAEVEGLEHSQLTGWMGRFWKRDPNPFVLARDSSPVIFEPGTQFHYSNPGMAILGYCITAALRGAPETDLKALLQKRIMEPLGIPPQEWGIGYGTGYELEGLTLYAPWGGGSFSANALARIGRLLLHRGNWDGRQLITEKTLRLVTTDAGMPGPDPSTGEPRSGLCWWVNGNLVFRQAPRDLFAGAGAGNQMLVVIPSLDMVIVRNGAQIDRKSFWGGVERSLLSPLMAAVTDPPYPPSTLVRQASFAAASEIKRAAIGSDNWPMTWGDDDAQYTSYGDGWGFEPRTESKLSLGFATVLGSPADFQGVNLRSSSGERVGDGAKGAKSSGMVMVDGVLYMLVRNVSNSQLAWSTDHGVTWQGGFRFETSFGCPCFVNYGPNYAGARDEYVYLYSSDGPSAYESYDQLVLARVRKDRLRDRDSYEFYAGANAQGRAPWSFQVADRQGVFRYPGRCQRCDAVYDAGLGRYLLALGYGHDGGWGIFEAPEPWGPWATVFHTRNWGLGCTHGYRLPAKWISPDGRVLHVVFSGVNEEGLENDAFCVRRLELELYPPLAGSSTKP